MNNAGSMNKAGSQTFSMDDDDSPLKTMHGQPVTTGGVGLNSNSYYAMNDSPPLLKSMAGNVNSFKMDESDIDLD